MTQTLYTNDSEIWFFLVSRRDQANLEGLRKLADGNRRKKTTEVGGAGGGGGVIRIPVLITACAEEIERRGLQEEGIYRTCGTTTAVNYLHGLFDKGRATLSPILF